MCPPKTPKYDPVVTQAETPVYATAPEPETAPKLVDDRHNTNSQAADIKAKRRGVGALRTDLGSLNIPDKNKSGKGLQIPS